MFDRLKHKSVFMFKKCSFGIEILFNRFGFSFIEVMVSLVVLSFGIVIIFKSFFMSFERIKYLNNRIYATMLLDNNIEKIDRMLRFYRALPSDFEKKFTLQSGSQKVIFNQRMDLKAVEEFNDVFELNLFLSWNEGKNINKLSRAAYISDAGYKK